VSDTPRTDAEWHSITVSAPWDAAAEQMAQHARQLERENRTFRAAQKACEECDAPRVDKIGELERELAEARKQLADLREGFDAEGRTAAEACCVAFKAEQVERIRELERELSAERALADKLASALTDSVTWSHALSAYEKWKGARREAD